MAEDNEKQIGKEKLEQERLLLIRHSASHVLAEAVLSVFPDAKFGIGPAIEDGFYYDFQLPRNLTPEDLPALEAKMAEIIKADEQFVRSEVSKEEALRLFTNQPYKLELINELPGDTVTVYEQGTFTDLCRGPHVKSTREITVNAFKLEKIAGAYWRGSEKESDAPEDLRAGFPEPERPGRIFAIAGRD